MECNITANVEKTQNYVYVVYVYVPNEIVPVSVPDNFFKVWGKWSD